MSAAAKPEGPKFNTPEWHEARKAEMRRLAERERYRRPLRVEPPLLRSLRAEVARLELRAATFGDKLTSDGACIDQRIFDLQQQIRAEELRLTDTPEGAVSVVKPTCSDAGERPLAGQGTEETGNDRPAAPISQRYAKHAATAASAREPGEDDDL